VSGLLKALGASEEDILTQFVIEALVISMVGAVRDWWELVWLT